MARAFVEDREDAKDPRADGSRGANSPPDGNGAEGIGDPAAAEHEGPRLEEGNGRGPFLAIKSKLGWDEDPARKAYSCYTCRHTFAHRMLSGYWNDGAGCSIETLAEFMGDTPKVAFDHYGREWGQHYQDPLWAAIGAGEPR